MKARFLKVSNSSQRAQCNVPRLLVYAPIAGIADHAGLGARWIFQKGFPLRIDGHVLKGSMLFLWQTTAGCYGDVSLKIGEAKPM